MKSTTFDGADVRIVLHGMITDLPTLARVSSQWEGKGLFKTQWPNLLGSWCVGHYKKFNKPPGSKIYRKFEMWASGSAADEKTVDSIERFLDGIREEEVVSDSSSYFLDIAGKLFNRIRLENQIEEAQGELEQGDLESAYSRLTGLTKVNLGKGSYLTPASEFQAWDDLKDRFVGKSLFAYNGAIAKLLGGSFTKGTFFAFMAPDKTGKTTWLTDIAYRAARARRRVAFFDTGDSIEREVLLRLACRVSRCPEYSQTLKFPTGWDSSGELTVEKRDVEEFDSIDAFKKFRRICKSPEDFAISCHDSGTLGVEDIDAILSDWERERDWRADVVVVDYADILAPPKGVRDTLEQIDETWKSLRRLSQRRDCLVVTATQSSSAIYGKEDALLGRKHFSGRKTKLAHVNGMLGINVSAREKARGVARLNWIVRRKGPSNERQFVTVAGVPAICDPVVVSKWG